MTTPRDEKFTPVTEGRTLRCSFCNKGPETVGELIDGPASRGCTPACICYDCVQLCASIFAHRSMLGGSEHERTATQEMLKEKIDQALSVLAGLEREVIKLRYGLSDGYTHTLDEVAGQFGITPERVCEIESRALDILRSRETQT
jgi:RNA polymerase sigma factor (sigma-70 family)